MDERPDGTACDGAALRRIERWLIGKAADDPDIGAIVEGLALRLRADGMPVVRATSHIRTPHPAPCGGRARSSTRPSEGASKDWPASSRNADRLDAPLSIGTPRTKGTVETWVARASSSG